jgi:WD40 repeat protein
MKKSGGSRVFLLHLQMKTSLSALGLALVAFSVSAQEKITYADHVRPLLENKCFSCHNPDKKKGDLDLTSFAATMAGGGGGMVVNSGDAESSRLITTTTKKEEPFMPPEGAPLGAKDIEILSKWVQGGLLETASSIAKKTVPKANLTLSVSSTGKPEGPPPMPEHVLLEPVFTAPRTTAVTALAASPWAPLVAMSGLKQALVYDTQTKVLAGIYPYPEGYIRSLKFSQNGSLLIAGGGRGGKLGNAVAWDVKTGKRVAEVGKEFDQVMCADISPNHSMIALGSPSKKLKCYNASTGEELYVMKKHTEWVMAVAFSPDGVLLASADRNGNVFVSEAENGGEFYILEAHKVAATGLAWRADSNILASCGEDGKIITYEMENGKVVKSWDAHGGGCLSVSFTPDGNIVSSGRDAMIRTWDINGKKLSESAKQADIVTKVAALHDSKSVVSGDWLGQVRVWSLDKFEDKGTLSSNPPPIAQRIIESERLAGELVAKLPEVEVRVKKAEEAVKAKEAQLAATRKKASDAEAYRNKLDAEIKDLPNKLAGLDKALQEAKNKRQSQIEVIKKHEQSVAEIKQLETSLASLQTEKGKLKAPEQAPQIAELDKKLAEATGKIDPLKKAVATAPQPVADFDKVIKDHQDQITALNAAKPNKIKELEGVKKGLEGWPKTIGEEEKQIADAKVALTTEQTKLNETRTQVAYYQKLPNLLRAAQFNVGVLSEKEKLEKLEAEVKSLQEAQKDAEAAKIAATQRIADTTKAIADAVAAQPGLEAAFAKLDAELPAVDKTLEPGKSQEATLATQLETHKKAIADHEARAKVLEQEKANRIAAAKKAEDDINKQIAALRGQRGEVEKKHAAPGQVYEQKKNVYGTAEANLKTAKEQLTAADKKQAESNAQVASADVALKEKKSDEAALKTALEAARKAQGEAKQGYEVATANAAKQQDAFNRAKAEFEQADKASAPLRGQLQNLNAQIDKQKMALAEKQAEPGKADKEFAEKMQPVQTGLAQAKSQVESIEKQLADVRTKLAADTKIVDAKRAEVGKAQAAVETAKLAQVNGKKTIEASHKEIADKDKMMGEIKVELAKAEPQLVPLRDKVKQLNEQYLTMLPK